MFTLSTRCVCRHFQKNAVKLFYFYAAALNSANIACTYTSAVDTDVMELLVASRLDILKGQSL